MKTGKWIILISLLLLLLAGTLLSDPLIRFFVDLHLEWFSQAEAIYSARLDSSAAARAEAVHHLKVYLDQQSERYLTKEMSYDRIMSILYALSDTDLPQTDIESCRRATETMEQARQDLAQADACFQRRDYVEAIPLYRESLIAEDYAALRLDQAQILYKNFVIDGAERSMEDGQYEAAQTMLSEGLTILGPDDDLSAALEDARKLEAGATYRSWTEEARKILSQDGPEAAFRYVDDLQKSAEDEYALTYLQQLLRHEYEADIVTKATALRGAGDPSGTCAVILEALRWIDSSQLKYLYAETRSTMTFWLVDQPVSRDDTGDPRTKAQSTIARDQILSDAQWQTYAHCFWADLGSVSFMLDEDFGTFAGTIALPLGEKTSIYRASATLQIYGDGQLLAEFKDMDGTSSPIPFSMPVDGVVELTLVWTSKGADGWQDWGRFAAIFDGRFLVPPPTA